MSLNKPHNRIKQALKWISDKGFPLFLKAEVILHFQEVSPEIWGFLDNTAEHYITPLSWTLWEPNRWRDHINTLNTSSLTAQPRWSRLEPAQHRRSLKGIWKGPLDYPKKSQGIQKWFHFTVYGKTCCRPQSSDIKPARLIHTLPGYLGCSLYH